MPKWIPLATPEPVEAVKCSLAAFRMKDKLLGVDIEIKEQGVLRVVFRDCQVMRIMDNAPVPNIEKTPHRDLVPNHLAYEMIGSSVMERYQGATDEAKHYRLLMPQAAVDVFASSEPKFTMLKIVGEGAY